MSLSEFRERVLAAIATHFPTAHVSVQEKRTIVLEIRVQLEGDLLLDIYHNELTGKTSYTLVHRGQRVFGYDNYRFWHCHPYGQPAEHVACEEPEIEVALAEVSRVVKRFGRRETEAD